MGLPLLVRGQGLRTPSIGWKSRYRWFRCRHLNEDWARNKRRVGEQGCLLARLGNVIYWIGCIAAGITVVAGAFEAASGAFGSPWYFTIVVLIATAIWLMGWSFRYFYSRI